MKLHPSVQPLADEIEAFCERRGWTATRFGKAALNDEHFVHDLRRGRNPSLPTIDRLRQFLSKQEERAS